MPKHIPPPFPPGTVESIARTVGDLYTGNELTRLLSEAHVPDPLGEGTTKWRRLAQAMSDKQASQRDGRPVVAVVKAAMAPDKTLAKPVDATVARDDLNQVLSLSGYRVGDDGVFYTTARATTDSEAAGRSKRLHTGLTQRGAHADVLLYCRPELLKTDFYEAVFESIKGLGHRLRSMTGETDDDGPRLVESVLEGTNPTILLNELGNRSQRDEQRGVVHLIKGLFAAFRNPASHEPRIVWSMTELDALDVLGTLSMVHRRLDAATLRT